MTILVSIRVVTWDEIISFFSLGNFLFFYWMDLTLGSTFSLCVTIFGSISSISLGFHANTSVLDFKNSNIYSFTCVSRLVLIFKKQSFPSPLTWMTSNSSKYTEPTRHLLLGCSHSWLLCCSSYLSLNQPLFFYSLYNEIFDDLVVSKGDDLHFFIRDLPKIAL